MTGLILLVKAEATLANASMLYLLIVTMAAVTVGRLPAIFASVLSLMACNWFFVEPRYTLTVSDPSEWLALCMFLFTATVTGQLTALLRFRAEEAQRSRLETAALAEASWAVATELDRDKAVAKVLSQLSHIAHIANAALILVGEAKNTVLATFDADSKIAAAPAIDDKCVRQVTESGRFASRPVSGQGDHIALSIKDGNELYLPVIAEERVIAVLYLRLSPAFAQDIHEQSVIESLVNHIAVILRRDELAKAEAKAQALAEADRLKTALLSMVSHDFRSPLTSIKASVSTLLGEGTPCDAQTQKELLQAVDNETDRLNRLVGNVLDLSRLEADAWRPHREATSIQELVGAALDSFGVEDNRRIHVELDPAIGDIYVDSVQIVQVLRNLLENALKYSPDQSRVDLAACIQGTDLIITVNDHGIGLPQGEEESIFDPFYRAPQLKESSVPGVGIGLAVCRGLVEAHGGRVTAANNPGGGAVLLVSLPVGK